MGLDSDTHDDSKSDMRRKEALKLLVEKKEKDTSGITSLFFLRVRIDKRDCDLDIDLRVTLK